MELKLKPKKFKTGLACMRLQPLHLGHKRLIDQILLDCDVAFIAIGSAQESGTIKNPISYSNRKELLENLYPNECQSRKLRIIPAKDIHDIPNWSKYLVKLIPDKVDIYYAGSGYDAATFTLFPPVDYPKISIEIIDRFKDDISASEIRILFKQGIPTWKKYIPKENLKITEKYLMNHNSKTGE